MTELKDIARKTHYDVLTHFTWVPDTTTYRKREHWTSHADEVEAGMHFNDDCDGFALTCIELCHRRGVPKQPLRLILCNVVDAGWHLVGGIDLEDGTWILDNRQRQIVPAHELDTYSWVQTMRLSTPGKWLSVPGRPFG